MIFASFDTPLDPRRAKVMECNDLGGIYSSVKFWLLSSLLADLQHLELIRALSAHPQLVT